MYKIIIMSIQIDINNQEYRNFIKTLSPNEIDVMGDDLSSCWIFAYYFHLKYNFPVTSQYECVYEKVLNLDELDLVKNPDYKFIDGLYSFYTENKTEFHHFIIQVIGNKVHLFSTYGGQWGIIKITHDINMFILMINKIYINKSIDFNDKISWYKKLYGIKTSIKELDLTECCFKYTYREFN